MAKKWLPTIGQKRLNKISEDLTEQLETPDKTDTSSNDGKRPFVLFADDDVNMRDYVRFLLKADYEILTVEDGVAALEVARTRPPDLILTDVMMPRMNGMQLLEALRGDPQTQDIPVILLSVRANESTKIDSFDAGADDYLVKPFTAPELLARIKAHIKLRKIRNQAYHAVKESKELFQSVFNGVPNSISVYKTLYHADGTIDNFEMFLVNDLMLKSLNLPKEEIVGKRYSDLFPNTSKLDILDLFKEVIYTGQPIDFERWYVQNGANRCFRFKASKLHDLLIVIADDVTLRRKAKIKSEQIRAKQLEMEERQQREIFRVTLRTQEEERRRISENLHNGLGQMLFSIKLNLDAIDLKNAKRPMEENIEKLKNAESLLADCIRESRRISHELMPTVLEDFGLKTAIENICSQLSGPCIFKPEVEKIPPSVDKEIELAIFRIVQELALNIVKHAQATEASIKIFIRNDHLNIIVSDNGIGFDIHKQSSNTTGLSTINNRINLLKGSLYAAYTTGKGTEIRIVLPIKVDPV